MDKMIMCEKCGIELKGWRKCASCGATPDRGRPPVLDDNITMQHGDDVDPLGEFLVFDNHADALLKVERGINENLQRRNTELLLQIDRLRDHRNVAILFGLWMMAALVMVLTRHVG